MIWLEPSRAEWAIRIKAMPNEMAIYLIWSFNAIVYEMFERNLNWHVFHQSDNKFYKDLWTHFM